MHYLIRVKLISILLALFFCASSRPAKFIASGHTIPKCHIQEGAGLTIENKTDRYSLQNIITTPIRTYEAWVETRETGVNQGSTIFADYTEEYNPGISFRVYTYGSAIGQPQLNIRYNRNTQKQFTIKTNICGTGRRHVAFTVSDTQIKGYLDGVLKNTWSFNGVLPTPTVPYSVGGDNRSGNSWWFRGTIHSVSAFSTVKSQAEIVSDLEGGAILNNCLFDFDFDNNGYTNRADPTNPLVPYLYDGEFVSPSSYDYTLAVVPDTQAVMYYHQNNFSDIYDCIIENKDEMKISMAIGLGDITERNIDSEWTLARENIYKLKDHNIPFSLVRGNHDVGVFGTTEEWRQLKFSQYFDNDTYRSQMSGFYDDKINNSYRLFEVCGVNYLLINLDYGADDDVLNWANVVVSSYPKHNVIVVTHAFLFRDGTFLDENDIYPPAAQYGYNNGDGLWNKFVCKHENISLVLCGHDPDQNIIKSTFVGDHGNRVTCLLIDPQYYDSKCAALGAVAFLHFANGGQDVSVDFYSSIQRKLFRHCNQLRFSLDVASSDSAFVDRSGGEYQTIIDVAQLNNGLEVIVASADDGYALHYENEVEATPIGSMGGKPFFDEKCDCFFLQSASGGWAIKDAEGRYIGRNGDQVVLADQPSAFVPEVYNGELYLNCSGKYLCFSEEDGSFAYSSNQTPINLYLFKNYNFDPTEEADRYIQRFMDSYLCGFDDYTPASEYIWNVLKDDYERLSLSAKSELKARLAENEAPVRAFKERYLRVVNTHMNLDDFLGLVSFGNANTLLYDDQNSLYACNVIVAMTVLSCAALVIAKKKRASGE